MAKYRLSLQAARANADLSVEEVAEKLGVAMSSIYNWERGKYPPRDERWDAIAELYGLRKDQIDWGKRKRR